MNTHLTETNSARVAARFSMAGRRALVTGGSLSIGRAIVLAFADAGADVAVQYAASADTSLENADAADTLAAAFRERGTRHAFIESDFMQPGAGTRTVQEAERRLGGVDVLVVCASVQKREAFTEISDYELERQRRINFDASVELLKAVVPGMGAAVGAASSPSAASTRPTPRRTSPSMPH